jgi:hypothetical protein
MTMKRSRWVALAVVLAVSGSFGSCLLTERRAETKAKSFCARFVIGGDFNQAVAAVNAAMDAKKGAFVHEGEQTVFVSYSGVPPYSRHLCSIDGIDDKIIRVSYEHVD